MRVLGLIPARGGSKGVPRKNVLELTDRILRYSQEAQGKTGPKENP